MRCPALPQPLTGAVGRVESSAGPLRIDQIDDPAAADESALLEPDAPGYVLDAWRRRRADIFRIGDRSELTRFIRVPIELEPVPRSSLRH
jgi:hypothetical protein